MDSQSAAVALAARGLIKDYDGTQVLRGISLDVHAGETLAVMGPSGSGKTTLLKCLAGILLPSRGSVIFDGESVDELDSEQRSQLRLHRFGFIYQDGQLLPELTVRENAALLLLLRGLSRKTALSEADEWLDRLAIGHLGERRLTEVSGGEAQRVAIARSLSSHPAVLFADEPTGSLDATTGREVMNALLDAAGSESTSIVLITHDRAIADFADRVVFISDGLLTPEALPAGSR